MRIRFHPTAWDDYLYWQHHDKAILRKINALIQDIQRRPYEGLGKPEPLKHELSGYWSRRITGEHRLVYCVEDQTMDILQCRYHY